MTKEEIFNTSVKAAIELALPDNKEEFEQLIDNINKHNEGDDSVFSFARMDRWERILVTKHRYSDPAVLW